MLAEHSTVYQLALNAFDAVKSIYNTVIPTVHTSRNEDADESGDLSKQLSLIANLAVCDHYRSMLWNADRHPEDVNNIMWGDKNIIGLVATIATLLPQDGVDPWKTGAAKWLSRNADAVANCSVNPKKTIDAPKWYAQYQVAMGYGPADEMIQDEPVAEIYGGAL